MSLTVMSCCTYLTDAAEVAWRPVDYDAHDFVMAVKGRSINGYAYVPCGGTIHRIEDSNRDMALDLFAQAVAAHVLNYGLDRAITLVPVPNSRADVCATTAAPRTLEQAQALARACSTSCCSSAIYRRASSAAPRRRVTRSCWLMT